MVFFLSNMIENQCMSTGAFEITLNGEPGAPVSSTALSGVHAAMWGRGVVHGICFRA